MKAEQLRKSILQMAIQGKLVPQDSSDEPASVLLEKIRAEKENLIKQGKIKKDKNDSVIFKGEDGKFYEKIGKEIKDITDELPFEIPDTWSWCRFSVFCKINGGFAFKSENYTNCENGIRVLRISDFDEYGIKNNKKVYYPYKENLRDYFLEESDIVMCMTGGTVGKTLLIESLQEKMLVNQRVADIKINKAISNKYVYFVLVSSYIREIIKDSKNSTNDNISIDLIKSFLLPIPPLNEQKRIIGAIEKFEPLLAEYEKLEQQATKLDNEIFDKLKKSVLQYAIQGKLVPQDSSDEPASVLLSQIKAEKENLIKQGKIKKEKPLPPITDDEKPFDIPDNWEWTRIKDITQSYIGITYKPADVVKEGGNIVLRSSNIQNGKLDLTDLVRVNLNLAEKFMVKKNDIIICARNGSKKLVGKSAIIDQDIKNMTFGAFMAICRTNFYKYIAKYLQSNCFFEQLANVSGTTTINQLTQNNFNAFMVPLPPLNEQKRIVARIEEIFAQIDKIKV